LKLNDSGGKFGQLNNQILQGSAATDLR